MKLRITVQGAVYDVDVEIMEEVGGDASSPAPALPPAAAPAPASAPATAPSPAQAAPASSPAPAAAPSGGGEMVNSPLAGSVFKILVNVGQEVAANEEVLILEAMKMEAPVSAPLAGKITAIHVSVGDAVQSGQALLEIG